MKKYFKHLFTGLKYIWFAICFIVLSIVGIAMLQTMYQLIWS